MGAIQYSLFDKSKIVELRPLLPHQAEALTYTKDKSKIALFMEMRLGKSLVAIRWAKSKINNKILIVGPLSVLPSWETELAQEQVLKDEIFWLTGFNRKKSIAIDKNGWYLVNYERLRVCPELLNYEWSTVILDESTRIRNPKAQITKLCINKFINVKNRAILSGLPAPESPLDYFEQFKFLNNKFLNENNYWKFRGRYFHRGFTNWDWLPNRGTIDIIKKEVHNLAFVKTRNQCNIGSMKIYEKRYVAMNPKQEKIYKDIEKKFAYDTEEGKDETKWATVKFGWMSQVAGGFIPREIEEQEGKKIEIRKPELISDVKGKELLNLLLGELKNEKIVVWFRYNTELRFAVELLNSHGIGNRYIDGTVDISSRHSASTEFKTSKNVRIMLAQIKCGKFGIDWSVASTAIYYSNPYDMEDRAQSEDRIIHATKKEPVLYIDLITKNTIDEHVTAVLRNKNIKSRTFMTELIEKWKEKWHENKEN